jgi:diguanylate cyclase (GGDEF)-like protein
VRAFQRSQLQASTDALTGLVNRRTLEGELRSLIKRGRRFALAMADLDRFKQLNDTHGHEAGDRALRAFAQIAQETLRADDTIARWGGEEFVIAVPDLDRQQTLEVFERIRARLAESHGGSHPAFTASFGVTDSSRGDTLEELLQLADAALYAAKEAGRDRVVTSDATSDVPSFAPAGKARPRKPRQVASPAEISAMHARADQEEPRPSGFEIR